MGYSEGETISIERRYAEGRLDRVPGLMKELVHEKVDVILATNNVAIRAARDATKTIPIVMISSIDPVAAGYIESFAQPGGNITGLAWLNRDISAKRIELLKEVLPALSRVGILWDTDGPGPAVAFKEYVAAARSFKLDLHSMEIRGPVPDFTKAFKDAKTARVGGVIVVTNPLIGQRARQVFDLAISTQLPAMAEEGQHVNAGGLISYGASLADLYRRAADYIVEIIRGAKPAELAVKLPSKFELFVNLKTAEKLGVVIPQHVMLQADKVIKD
jgi:putative ABC transport system substrate-binding protein